MGAAFATPLTDLESLSLALGHVTLVWTIILQYTVAIVTSNFAGTISVVPTKSSYFVYEVNPLITDTQYVQRTLFRVLGEKTLKHGHPLYGQYF